MHSPEEQLFEQALELPPGADRADFLRSACHGDLKLELRVGQLLAAHESASSLLDAPVVDPLLQLLAAPETDACGESIGPYKLLELIGEGGMGLVYMAEQEHPVRRRVALKIIKPGMDTRQVIARFEAERRALERLDHPGVARVLDAGITPAGRPYFVMELVRGIGITEFCDQAQLDTRARLELFIRVCQAVQHAHDAGIIHRDLKPANVLVTIHDGVPVPKIIDFGIAKATEGRLTDHTLFTNFLQMIGTPVYMSPEQAQLTSQDVDERSDVYSLGVVLYELLTGTTPFAPERLRSVGIPEVQRIIRDEDPPAPSARVATLAGDELSTIATRSSVDPRRYRTSLRGDLDWIVLRALEKDRSRRYQSAGALLNDLDLFLKNRPIHARPPSALYRCRKFLKRRHTGLIAGLALLLVTGVSLAAILQLQRVAKDREQRVLSQENSVRTLQYVADIQRAAVAWQRGRTDEIRRVLAPHIPAGNSVDRRGFEWHYLWNLCEAHPRVFNDHQWDVYDTLWSPSGKLLVTVGGDHKIVIRDAATDEVRTILEGFTLEPNTAVFTPDESTLIVGQEDGVVSIWDLRSGRQRSRIEGFANPVARVFLTPDPDLVLVVDQRWTEPPQNTTLCRISTSERLRDLRQYRALQVTPSKTEVLIRNTAGVLEIRGLPGLDVTRSFPRMDTQYDYADYSSDGTLLVTGSGGGVIQVWRAGDSPQRLFETSTSTRLRAVSFSPDGSRFSACGDDGVARIWNARTFQLQHVLWSPHGRCWSCRFSPDCAQIALGRDRGAVQLYKVADLPPASRLIYAADQKPKAWSFDPGSNRLAVAQIGEANVHIIDTATGQAAAGFQLPDPQPIAAMSFAPDAQSMWIGTSVGRIEQIDVRRKTRIKSVDAPAGFTRIAVSPDSSVVSTVLPLTFWDAKSGRRLSTIDDTAAPVHLGGFADERTAIVFKQDGTRIEFVDPDQRHETRPAIQLTSPARGFAISPDRSLLAIGTGDSAIRIWDVATATERHILLGHGGASHQFAFSPDGRILASASASEVRLWHVATGQHLMVLEHLYKDIATLAFSADGEHLIVAGRAFPDASHGVIVYDAHVAPPPVAGNFISDR